MKRKLKTIVVSVATLAVSGVVSVNAAATMTISDGIHTPVAISDNSGLDQNSDLGVIEWEGLLGNWDLKVNTGCTKPSMGSAVDPKLSLIFLVKSSAAGALSITFGDNGYGPLEVDTAKTVMSINGVLLGGSIVYSTSVNGFSTSSPVMSGAPFEDERNGTASGLLKTGFDMSQTVTITHTGKGFTQGDAYLAIAVPEASTYVAGAVLLLPFAATTVRILRKNRSA